MTGLDDRSNQDCGNQGWIAALVWRGGWTALCMLAIGLVIAGIPFSVSAQDVGSTTQSIRGGVEAQPGQFDAVVEVVTPLTSDGCTGTLITDEFVLTAGHCVCDPDENGVQICGNRSRVKFKNVLTVGGSVPTEVTIEADVHLYPFYDDLEWNAMDFALLELDTPASDLVEVDPIYVEDAPSTIVEGDLFTIVGYGYSDDASTNDCANESFGMKRWGQTELDEYEIDSRSQVHDTLHFNDSNVGGCPGDSGGPVLNYRNRVAGVGSTGSWGHSGAASRYGSVFSASAWIAYWTDTVGLYHEPISPAAPDAQRLDWCNVYGDQCGAPAAHAFCRVSKGETWVAETFAKQDDVGETHTITGNQLCTHSGCDSFESIECAPTWTRHDEPTWDGYRVDQCVTWGTDCGAGGANYYCERQHGPGWKALDFAIAHDVGPTRILGSGQVCHSSDCDGFEHVTCYFDPPEQMIPNDGDSDGVTDGQDNCPATPNPLQTDADGDSIGDVCDVNPQGPNDCADGIDNDGDGLVDAADSGCSDTSDGSERGADLPCDDGVDNDSDGAVDYPADPQCNAPTDPTEAVQCADGRDNDRDGLADEADPDCDDANDHAEWHLSPGDLLVTNNDSVTPTQLLRIEPRTGIQTVLTRGSPLEDLYGVAFSPEGEIYLADGVGRAIYRLDPASGWLTRVAHEGGLFSPRYFSFEPSGSLVVADSVTDAVHRVFPETGTQVPVASGEHLTIVIDAEVEQDGMLVATDYASASIVRIHPETGEKSVVSSLGLFGLLWDLAIADDGQFFVTDVRHNEIYRVDPASGEQTVVSSEFTDMRGMAIDEAGQLIVADPGRNSVVRVDPETGASQHISSDEHLSFPMGVSVVPTSYVPEPDGLLAILAGIVALPAFARRRERQQTSRRC